ncbi:hypothetical protein UNSW3_706 [Campylobacter concisus UNSW3]|uniref:Uncharacterized protein n=1 Tax=Campylobacter concisus UNSW3 TaxID=1242966 RepID=U2F1N5_9BACT|nr:hypothetical protein [Campylobacter concisus]ERJ24077.1 hypothetical protein UNSW3_706 [Campylobacter concisus UNSW3]
MKKALFIVCFLASMVYGLERGATSNFKYIIDTGVQSIYVLNGNLSFQLVFNFFDSQRNEKDDFGGCYDYRNMGEVIVDGQKAECTKNGKDIECFKKDGSGNKVKALVITPIQYNKDKPQDSSYCVKTQNECLPLTKVFELKSMFVKNYDIKLTQDEEDLIRNMDVCYTGPYGVLDSYRKSSLNSSEHMIGHTNIYFSSPDIAIEDSLRYENTTGNAEGDYRDVKMIKNGKEKDIQDFFTVDKESLERLLGEKGVIDLSCGMSCLVQSMYIFNGKMYVDQRYDDLKVVPYRFIRDILSEEGSKYIKRY